MAKYLIQKNGQSIQFNNIESATQWADQNEVDHSMIYEVLTAFRTYQQCEEGAKPSGVPDEWPWIKTEIPSSHSEDFINAGYQVMNDAAFAQYLSGIQSEHDSWANQYDVDLKASDLKIYDIVEEDFKTLPPHKIDFRRHLKKNIYLQKNVIMLPNGRPQKSLYYYNGDLVAEIEFVFDVNAMNFMIRRKELLSYCRKTGALSSQWVIADDSFDVNNTYHLREMMSERSNARAMIIEEVKAFLNGVLAQYYLPQGKTYPEILEIAGQFWDKYSTPIDSWINVGAPQFKNLLTGDTDFAFLPVEISAGVTVRSYILAKTSY